MCDKGKQSRHAAQPVSLGVNLHPTSLRAAGSAPRRTRSSTGSPRRGALLADPPAQPARRVRLPVRVGVRFRVLAGLLADPRQRSRRRSPPLRGGERVLDPRLGRVRRRRRARRAGALRARVVGAAPLRRRARRAARRRRADLRRRGELRPPRAPRALPPARLRRRRPARRPQRERPEVGQPALRLGRARARRATAGGSSACGGCSTSSTSSGSTTFAPSPATGRCPSRPRPLATGTGRAGPGAAVFRAAERELGELPVVVEDLGVITPDVEALRDELGFPGMAVILWAFQGPPDNPHRLENHRVHQVVYTSTHDTNTLAGPFPDRPRVGAARADALLAGGPRDGAGAGRARARRRGADEPPRRGRRQLGLAARAGAARERRRRRACGPPPRPRGARLTRRSRAPG